MTAPAALRSENRSGAPLLRPITAGSAGEPSGAPPRPAMPRAGTAGDRRTWLTEAGNRAPGAVSVDGPVRLVPPEDPGAWSGSLVRAAVEALTGSRPVAQLARWMTGEIYDSLSRRAGLAVRIKGRPTLVRQAVVRSVRVCEVAPLANEASVVVHDGTRVRAAAVRIEAHRGRWRATALEIG